MSKRTLIAKNSHQAQIIADAWENQKDQLQTVIDAYNTTGLPALEPGELARLFNDTPSFLFDKLAGGEIAQIAIGSGSEKTYLPLNKEHAIAIMQRPDGYDALIDAVKNLSAKSVKGIAYEAGRVNAGYNTAQIEGYFEIDAEGALQYAARVQTQIDEAGCYYINSDAGHSILSFVQDAVKAWYANDMPGVRKQYATTLPDILNEVIETLDDKNKTFVCRAPEFVKLDRQLLNGEQ